MKPALLAAAIAAASILPAQAGTPQPWQLRPLTHEQARKVGNDANAKFLADEQKYMERQQAEIKRREMPAVGNGCGGTGVVANVEIEKAADAAMENPSNNTAQQLAASFKQQFDQSIAQVYDKYMNDRTRTANMADLVVNHDQDQKTIRECTPHFAKMIDEVRAKAAAEKSAADAAHAKQVAEAQRPENKLFEAYWRFAFVQYCHKVRDGYLLIYVSDPEFERAQMAAKAVEKTIVADAPSLNTDAIWQRAINYPGQRQLPVNRGFCQMVYNQLVRLSAIGAVDLQKP